jgi:putative restriction endonuclease
MPRTFGEIPGYPEGTLFDSRELLSQAGVHRPRQAGISGAKEEGADSIVLSGGYEDDEDRGNEILYTGHGGRDQNTGYQIADQEFERGNAALARNNVLGLPVRVIRDAQLDSPYAPNIGYRYDGLYSVAEYWEETGISGSKVWRYLLVKSDPSEPLPPLKPGEEAPPAPPASTRRAFTTTRIVRDSDMSREIKRLYEYCCQVCEVRLETPAGPYAEGAHIKPLGMPHNGPDVRANLLCLCPNHHVLFDDGAIAISDDRGQHGGSLRSISGSDAEWCSHLGRWLRVGARYP